MTTPDENFALPVEYKKLSFHDRRLVREQYIKEQNNSCIHCGGSLGEVPPSHITKKTINWKLFPPNFLAYPVHLHHSHKTGLTLGAVHAYCSAVLWQYHGE